MSSLPIRWRSNCFFRTILILSRAMAAGCAGPLTKSILVSNDVQEDAETQLLVRNILRARDHLPMHFTAISQVRVAPDGFGLGTPGVQATIPFGGPGAGYALTPSLTSPSSVDTTPLTSQEFYQGITNPLTGSVMSYYLEQGWPPDLVLNLFIQSVEYTDRAPAGDDAGSGKGADKSKEKATRIGRLENDGKSSQADFNDLIRQMLKCEIVDDKDTEFTMYGAPQGQSDFTNLRALAEAKTAKLLPVYVDDKGNIADKKYWEPVDPAKRRVAFGEVTEIAAFRFEKGSSKRTSDCAPLSVKRSVEALIADGGATGGEQALSERITFAGNVTTSVGSNSLLSELQATRRRKARPTETEVPGPDAKLRIVLRSPEGMLRYLGRLSANGALQPCLLPSTGECTATTQRALFQISSTSGAPPAITVDYRDGPYYVANFSDTDRSVQVLALVMQLLALQNKGTQAPATTNVRVLR